MPASLQPGSGRSSEEQTKGSAAPVCRHAHRAPGRFSASCRSSSSFPLPSALARGSATKCSCREDGLEDQLHVYCFSLGQSSLSRPLLCPGGWRSAMVKPALCPNPGLSLCQGSPLDST